MSETYDQLNCPLCDAPLHITFSTAQGLFTDVLSTKPGDQPEPAGSHTQTWQVECEEGHVLLLPGDLECPQCGDSMDCTHDDLDSNDDWRTFRPHDADRLRVTLERIVKVATS